MILPLDFHFNQANLQDYVDCRRRFQLRHLLRLPWPAVEVEPVQEVEALLKSGIALHRLIHQHHLGFPEELLTRNIKGADLKRWWSNYLKYPPSDLPSTRIAEVLLTASIAGGQLVAKYDLLAVEPGERAVIVDWKTSFRRPPNDWLAERLQTRVYRYLLIRAGSHYNGGKPILPEQIEMIYWFSNHPKDPAPFLYDAPQFQADELFLSGLIHEISSFGEDEFDLTEHRERCRYCLYRSLCERGIGAGKLDKYMEEIESTETLTFDLDFDQIAEIEF